MVRTKLHGIFASNWWGANVPTTQNVGTATTWVANMLTFTVPGRVAGFRFYASFNDAGHAGHIGVLTDDTPAQTVYCMVAHMTAASHAVGWHQMWGRPWFRITPGNTYQLSVLYPFGDFSRNNNALSSFVTRNGIQFQRGFQTTALDLTNVSPTFNTNANAVDVLFHPD